MLEKWLLTVGAVSLSFAWGAGFMWAQGGFTPTSDTSSVAQPVNPELPMAPVGYGNATPMPSPSPAPIRLKPKPTATPKLVLRQLPAQPRVGSSLPSSTGLAGTGSPPTDTPPTTTPSSGAGTQFTMATFNLLGSSHTAKGGHSPGMASGVARMPGALQILAQHQVSVAGLQEFQPDQRAAFQRQATGWAMYPGLSMGRKAGENSVAWRTDTWDLVKTGLVDITYFNGRERPMPYVLLKNKATGAQAYFSTFHNPANIGGNMQRWRAEATSREIKLFNELEATGIPQLVTGDMNERAEYFCRVTAGTRLLAAAGGSNDGSCRPPKPIGIDWILGSPSVKFSDYTVDRSPLVRRTTDHPVVVTHVTLGAAS
ncbi:endonuclease/exonuclease/phosphatase family protein [Marmoricola sp. URHB0036]|uniref:endonuclease/exonuclease/phosphatase family protein n=1 Tax=Marmoricola sp. URHB0036 TaxID=1298863 RepID=UPI0004040F9F|nr:endonuclease/exonuclease/phosphatase family protein [Marmoricola sp. URHB0036]